MPNDITTEARKGKELTAKTMLGLYERGWYDISMPGRNVKYIFYPGKEVYTHPFYERNKKQVDENLSHIKSLIRQKLFNTPVKEKKEYSSIVIQEKNPTYTIEDLNLGVLKGYDITPIYKDQSFKEGGVSYREDGSIVFLNQNEAYNTIWSTYTLINLEVLGIILEHTVIVLPIHFNEIARCTPSRYTGYKFNNGKFIDGLNNIPLIVIGTIHTHPVGFNSDPSGGDVRTFANNTPRKSIIILSKEGRVRGSLPHMFLYKGENKEVSQSLNEKLNHLKIEDLTKEDGFDLRTYIKELNKIKTIYD